LPPTLVAAALAVVAGCPDAGGGGIVPNTPGPANTRDKTNGGTRFVGSVACKECHSDYAAWHERHGHAHALKRIQGRAPQNPSDTFPGVPVPPAGRAWSEISYLVGGYVRAARFVDLDGFLLSAGAVAGLAQYKLGFAPNATTTGFTAFDAGNPLRQPFDFQRFAPRSTGARAPDAEHPEFQDNRPGMAGTFIEPAVQCEACHGPGGRNFRTDDGVIVDRSRIHTDTTTAETCGACHSRPFNSRSAVIPAADGFIENLAQRAELKASGAHARFTCTTCHDPHEGATYGEPSRAIRNGCLVCRRDANMAGHAGAVYRRASDG
jgi:hypothetical protein